MAVNAATGDIAWRVLLGTSDELEAKGLHNLGAFGQGGPIATAGGLVFIAGTNDKRFRAFDSRTGKLLWETRLDSEGHTSPMTYRGRNGKQYVVIVSSGVNAFSLDRACRSIETRAMTPLVPIRSRLTQRISIGTGRCCVLSVEM
jgi:quinoprotein glucose dehydrogenase